jgi:hypothetical protein
MQYSTPDLVVLGAASVLVQGGMRGVLDNGSSDIEQPADEVTLGLDE